MQGNVFDGFQFIGPFLHRETAEDWADKEIGIVDSWTVVPVIQPYDFNKELKG